jgi:hypothetical protein
MPLKPEQQPALTHEQRVLRLQQLTTDLAKAVDLAEEQRRALRDIARDASELADALGADSDLAEFAPSPARRKRRAKKR